MTSKVRLIRSRLARSQIWSLSGNKKKASTSKNRLQTHEQWTWAHLNERIWCSMCTSEHSDTHMRNPACLKVNSYNKKNLYVWSSRSGQELRHQALYCRTAATMSAKINNRKHNHWSSFCPTAIKSRPFIWSSCHHYHDNTSLLPRQRTVKYTTCITTAFQKAPHQW